MERPVEHVQRGWFFSNNKSTLHNYLRGVSAYEGTGIGVRLISIKKNSNNDR